MKILSIVGTRPQLIKIAPLSKAIREQFDAVVIHTGQHYDEEMDGCFFEELNIPPPNYNLEVGSGTHGYQTGEMIKRIENKLIGEEPDLVLVYGDSNTTLAGALASIKLGIPVGHVEAGCRTFDLRQPEEVNRICTDHVSQILFAITTGTVRNLLNEGIPSERICLTGSTIVDACLYYSRIAEKKSKILSKMDLEDTQYHLVTIHRPENVDFIEPLSEITSALLEMDQKVVFPIHPRTRKKLYSSRLMSKINNSDRIIATNPLGYLDFMNLMQNALLVLSDSGSIQQEVIALKKKCVRLKASPSFPEVLTYKGIITVPPNKQNILQAVRHLAAPQIQNSIQSFESPLGEGNASEKIVHEISEHINDLKSETIFWRREFHMP